MTVVASTSRRGPGLLALEDRRLVDVPAVAQAAHRMTWVGPEHMAVKLAELLS
jgi:hypothetical protein